MAYQLKTIRYKDSDCRILLQNENGPCPLLAAANALLLKHAISLPTHCLHNGGVASLEDVTNMLANQAMQHYYKDDDKDEKQKDMKQKTDTKEQQDHSSSQQQQHHHFVSELLEYIPKFQYGMDVNPCLMGGSITSTEYTAQISAFDMMRVKLVHGWLVDPQDVQTVEAMRGRRRTTNDDDGDKNKTNTCTYNAAVEKVIHGKEASAELERVHAELERLRAEAAIMELQQQQERSGSWDLLEEDEDVQQQQQPPTTSTEKKQQQDSTSRSSTVVLHEQIDKLCQKQDELLQIATQGSLVEHFLDASSHQLTHYGLQCLYQELQDDELCVFFRNNHFATLTKHQGLLYLLVTDLGYSHTPDVVWEKLDVIDGDTEYVNSRFERSKEQKELLPSSHLSPEQLLAQSSQKDADYHLALHLSMQESNNKNGTKKSKKSKSSAKDLEAQEGQLLAAATQASLRNYHGLDDGIKPQPVEEMNKKKDKHNESKTEHVEVGVPAQQPPSGKVGTTSVVLPPSDGSSSSEMAGAATTTAAPTKPTTQEEADKLLAMQLQAQTMQNNHPNAAADRKRLEDASLSLARRLQAEEDRLAAAADGSGGGGTAAAAGRPQATTAAAARRRPQVATGGESSSSSRGGCVIS